MTPHPQADILRAIADGKTIEVKELIDNENAWEEVCNPWNFILHKDYELRIKPALININGHEVPEPVREPLKKLNRYWFVDFSENRCFCESEWDGDEMDYFRLQLGLIHLTKESAIAHTKALLSFTRSDK